MASYLVIIRFFNRVCVGRKSTRIFGWHSRKQHCHRHIPQQILSRPVLFVTTQYHRKEWFPVWGDLPIFRTWFSTVLIAWTIAHNWTIGLLSWAFFSCRRPFRFNRQGSIKQKSWNYPHFLGNSNFFLPYKWNYLTWHCINFPYLCQISYLTLIQLGSGNFIYMARKSWNFPENEGNSKFYVLWHLDDWAKRASALENCEIWHSYRSGSLTVKTIKGLL